MKTGGDNQFEIDFVYMDERISRPTLHTHQRYEVFYLHGGTCTYLIGSNIYKLKPGDILLLNGMTLHCPKVDPENEYIRSVIHFEHEGIQPFLQSIHSINVLSPYQEVNNFRHSLSGQNRREMEEILKRMNSFNRDDIIEYNRFRLCFLDLLHFLYRQYQRAVEENKKINASSHQEENVQRLISYLEENFMEDITMEVLQSHMHMNKFYLARLFKKVTGTTIFNYLYEHRINKAKMMFLIDKRVSVTEVCYKVGFKHLSHFSRLFKQHVGIAPESFKKLYGE